MLAGLLAVAAFDLTFVQPYGTFSVSDVRYLLTFVMMLVVALVMGGLTTRVREQASVARLRERRASTLYAVSRDLAAARTRPELGRVTLRHLHDLFGGSVMLILPDVDGQLDVVAEMPPQEGARRDLGVAKWVFEHGESAGRGTQTLPAAEAVYVPLATPGSGAGRRGAPPGAGRIGSPTRRSGSSSRRCSARPPWRWSAPSWPRKSGSCTSSSRRSSCAPRSSVRCRTTCERRSPESRGRPAAWPRTRAGSTPATRRELAQTIVDEARRMTRLVANLLDMVRVESGALGVHREWHVLEEVVGVALLRAEERLSGRPITTDLPPTLPLVPIDDVLIEQVLINLLENAAKYTPAGSPIDISASARRGEVLVTVADRGPGVPPEESERIFEKFHRAARGAGGVGLGLAICRGIIKAHGGRLWVDPREGGGAAFRFTLPIIGTPPTFERESGEVEAAG